MEEKETKTVTMPLSEFEQMRRDIQDLKIKAKEDLREKVKKCVGMSIEEIEDFYRIRGESFTYHMDCVKDHYLQTLKKKIHLSTFTYHHAKEQKKGEIV